MARTARSAGPPGGPSPGSSAPAPMSAARRAAVGSESASQTAAPRSRSASATEVPISPVPITTTLRGPWSPGTALTVLPASLCDVQAQRGGAAQVHVLYPRARRRGLHVHQQPDHARHRPRHVDLGAAQQRHVLEAELARGERGKLRVQVPGGAEHHADHVRRGQPVARHHLCHQLGRALEDRRALVRVDLDRAAYRPDRHQAPPPHPLRPAPPSPPFPALGLPGYRPTAAYRSPISLVDRRRVAPGRSEPSATGPTWVRTSRLTGWPTSASIRRTMCLRPSCSVISTRARLPARSTTRKRSALATPSESSTPVISWRPRSLGSGPATSAR